MDERSECRTETGEKADRQKSVSLSSTAEIDRISPTHRPEGKPIGYQTWLDLLFLHWRVPAEEIQALLPGELTVDTFDGDAWVGLVPFKMRKVRPWWSPPVPGISSFYETNVRTYVHHRGQDPGVWFFSLDAASSLAVRVARWKWNLNYFKATMHSTRHQEILRYESRRPFRKPISVFSNVETLLPEVNPRSLLRSAEPNTLEHFLVERYLLYAFDPRARSYWRGQVHHPAYKYCPVELLKCNQTLLEASGINVDAIPESVLYCPGVDVEIFPLKPLTI